MPPIELGPVRPIGAVDARVARQAGGQREQAERAGKPAGAVALSDALTVGDPPIDTDRIAVIRKAVETGEYPVFPARIADAMIAAGLLLRKGK
jgi:negative regulator of flagellin synthesis FlgM